MQNSTNIRQRIKLKNKKDNKKTGRTLYKKNGNTGIHYTGISTYLYIKTDLNYRKNLKTKIIDKIYMAGVSFLTCPHNKLINT